MEQSKRRLSEGVTEEKLKEFWKHSINPISGFRVFKNDYTNTEKVDSRHRRAMKDKFNRE